VKGGKKERILKNPDIKKKKQKYILLTLKKKKGFLWFSPLFCSYNIGQWKDYFIFFYSIGCFLTHGLSRKISLNTTLLLFFIARN